MTFTVSRERATPARHKRPVHHHWLIRSLVALVVVAVAAWALWSVTDQRGGDAAAGTPPGAGSPESAASPAATGNAEPADGADARGKAESPGIELGAGAPTARSMEAVLLTGRSEAAPGTALRVQVLERPGRWADFPLPTVVDEVGRFRTYVELGGRGVHRVRVVDPASGATSAVVAITIR